MSAIRNGCAILALLLIAAAAGLFWLLDSGSSRSIYQRTKSPDGWNEARVQFDDAGAVSSFSRLVFVKHSWNPSDEPLASCRAFWGEGEAQVKLTWQDSSTLLIEHHFAPDRVEAVAEHCGSVRIIARAIQPFETN